MIRTITLLRYLSEPQLREQITAITNKAEAFHGYSEWLTIGGRQPGSTWNHGCRSPRAPEQARCVIHPLSSTQMPE